MKKVITVFLCAMILCGVSACSTKKTEVPKEDDKQHETNANFKFTDEGRACAEQIIENLKDDYLDIDYYTNYENDSSIELDAGDTANYVGRVDFNDRSFSKDGYKNKLNSGRIEIFNTEEEALERYNYVKDDTSSRLTVALLKDNILLRLNRKMSNALLLKYDTSFKSTTNNLSIPDYIIYDYFFDNDLRWNMSYKEAKDVIDFSKNSGGLAPDNQVAKNLASLEFSGHSTYDGDVRYGEEYVFLFPDNVLKAYWVNFDKHSKSDEKDYISLYNQIKNQVVNMYGNPDLENFNWTDEKYKSDESDWSTGFRYGYLTIEAQWTSSDNKDIVMRWDYEDGMMLIICEKGYIPYL